MTTFTYVPTPVLFLDVDGTVRYGPDDPGGGFVNGPEDVRIFPQAQVMMQRWKAGGGRIVGCSNQGGIALGLTRKRDVVAAMDYTNELLGGLFDVMLFCEHHPRATDPAQRRCMCRKPAPGMIFQGLVDLSAMHPTESYEVRSMLFVGDRLQDDREAARRANVDFLAAATWRSRA